MKSRKNTHKPDWAPEHDHEAFAVSVVEGVDAGTGGHAAHPRRREKLSVDAYVDGVVKNDRSVLARAITLIESDAPAHRAAARALIGRLLPHAGRSLRIGITGIPGAGKSTFIETFGLFLLHQGHRVAVLAVDPSSTVTRGSILGDKARMERLSRDPRCFIRPSPTGGALGGVTRKSRETILACEAAGYDIVLVETVGVGQSEVTVRSMVDFFLLLLIAGAGDELQAVKKGVMELADAVAINKADGDNRPRAEAACAECAQALHYLSPATPGWQTAARTCSAVTGDGIPEIWRLVQEFAETTASSGVFEERRKRQSLEWVHAMIEEHLSTLFYQNAGVRQAYDSIRDRVLDGTLVPAQAADELIASFTNPHSR